MSKEDEIIKKLQSADIRYYNDDESALQLSDSEYDQLKEQAKREYPNNPYFKNIGAPVSEHLSTVTHRIPMGSLDKVKTEAELERWCKSMRGI